MKTSLYLFFVILFFSFITFSLAWGGQSSMDRVYREREEYERNMFEHDREIELDRINREYDRYQSGLSNGYSYRSINLGKQLFDDFNDHFENNFGITGHLQKANTLFEWADDNEATYVAHFTDNSYESVRDKLKEVSPQRRAMHFSSGSAFGYMEPDDSYILDL